MESESKAGTSNSPQMVGSNIETWCGQFEMNIPFSGSSWRQWQCSCHDSSPKGI